MGKRVTIEQRKRWNTSGAWETGEMRSWRRYAEPINQALIEKWKDGEPQERYIIRDNKASAANSRTQSLGVASHWREP